MIKFEINKQEPIYLRWNFFVQVVNFFNSEAKLKGNNYFSLAFVDDKTIHKLNKKYRGKNRPTDVLSFAEEKDGFIVNSKKEKYLGEIIISVPQARKQAKEYGVTLKDEVTRLLVHGLSHLIGYDHEGVSEGEAEKMVSFEDRVRSKIK